MNHFQVDCRSNGGRRGTENEVAQDSDKKVDMMNINSFSFNIICSVITAKLKTSSSQNNAVIHSKIDKDSLCNIIPYHIFKSFSLGKQKNSWQQPKVEASF